jgi:deoxycytidylate deaminase
MFTKRRQEQTKSENSDDFSNLRLINKKHQLFLSKAAELALKSNMLQKHGAVIVYKNKIIATGYNEICNYMNNNYSIHAEVSAISKLFYNKKILEFCDIYVVRIASATFDNCLKNSKPCRSCTNFINKYNIRNIYYSTNYAYEKMIIK